MISALSAPRRSPPQVAIALSTAQDHKRVGDGDTGPNTGGMGAYSPAPVMTAELIERTMAEIVRPTIAAMAQRGTPYRGVLYAGLMLTAEGPKLIEYNVRFGDPETQALMMRLDDDLLELMLATVDGSLAAKRPRWNDDAARKQLVQLFDAWGPSDPATSAGRQRLSSLLFA